MNELEMVRDEVLQAIYDQQVRLAQGGSGWLYVRVHPDGRVESGYDVSPCLLESEYFNRPGAPLTIWSGTLGDSAPRDSWEWIALDDCFDADSEDAEILSEAIEAAGSLDSLLRYGTKIEHDGKPLCVFYDREQFFSHNYTPHDWDPPQLSMEQEADLADLFAAIEDDADASA